MVVKEICSKLFYRLGDSREELWTHQEIQDIRYEDHRREASHIIHPLEGQF